VILTPWVFPWVFVRLTIPAQNSIIAKPYREDDQNELRTSNSVVLPFGTAMVLFYREVPHGTYDSLSSEQ
jgi:hypothetical protein